jgi:ATP-dependent exoDNAse (exonuclease V) beta subunit
MQAEPAIDAVKVMTHHAAKGLEWPVVVLANLAASIKDRLWSISAQSQSAFDVGQPLADRFIRYWPWPFGKLQKVAVADAIALTPVAEQFRTAAVEEAKRLMYVSMTRARDLMVLARSSRKTSGEWLDAVEAPWLLPEQDVDCLTLPDGEKIAAERWLIDPVGTDDAHSGSCHGALHWFPGADGQTARLPLSFSPSSGGHAGATVLEKCLIGERIPVAAGANMTVLGEAIHACLALSFVDRGVPVTESDIAAILSGFGVADCLLPSAVLRQVEAFHAWLAARWPDAKPYAEIAVQGVLASGQVMNGRIDLLLKTDAGWILIDHKSSPLAPDAWDRLATDYGAQLAAYADAVRAGSGEPVLESWLFLPVAGGGLRIELTGEVS